MRTLGPGRGLDEVCSWKYQQMLLINISQASEEDLGLVFLCQLVDFGFVFFNITQEFLKQSKVAFCFQLRPLESKT
jgi:hypothetical protein